MIGGGGLKALLSSGGGKGLYAGVWGNLAGESAAVSLNDQLQQQQQVALYMSSSSSSKLCRIHQPTATAKHSWPQQVSAKPGTVASCSAPGLLVNFKL
jgi:outer membrane lipoprotein SlyB